jgi:hypothetical protein
MATAPTPPLETKQHTARIAQLNDAARHQRLKNSRTVFTRNLLATLIDDSLPADQQALRRVLIQSALLRKMANAEFTADNDPHGEHDFGALEYSGHKLFWKIDVYENDGSFQWGAEKPWDETTSFRLVTVMLASDY